MARCLALSLALVIAVPVDGTVPALAASPETADAHHTPPLRLAEPDWRPLSGKQIEAKFADRDVIVDETYEPVPGVKIVMVYAGGCPPIETFAADGRWRMTMCSRSLRVYDGRWSIEPFRSSQQLCVSAIDFPKACRFVWRGANDDQVIMPAIKVDDMFGDYYNLYRVRRTHVILPPSTEQLKSNHWGL